MTPETQNRRGATGGQDNDAAGGQASSAPNIAPTRPPVNNRGEIRRALGIILQPGQVRELRAIDAVTPSYRKPHTVSGYFDTDHLDELAKAAATLNAKGIYFTPNPVNPALLARAANRVRPLNTKDPTTADPDITRRAWLLIDADPVRPSGISATDTEHDSGLTKAKEIRDCLTGHGWPAPISADSGNGAHLLYRIDLPADDGGLVKRVLEALAIRFNDEGVEIDQGVFSLKFPRCSARSEYENIG